MSTPTTPQTPGATAAAGTTPAQVEALVLAQAQVLGLPLPADCRPGVMLFMQLASGMAERVMSAPLGIEDEPATVFRPLAPRGSAA